MPVTKYRTLAIRGTEQSFSILYHFLFHLAPFASELKAVSAVGQPESGYILEVTEPIPVEQLPHLEVELIG